MSNYKKINKMKKNKRNNNRSNRNNNGNVVPYYNNQKQIIANAGFPRVMLTSPRYIEVDIGMNVVGSWTIIDLLPVTQGIGDSNRLGQMIRVHDIDIIGSLNAQNADIFTDTRLVLFQWTHQSALLPPNMANVMQDVNSFYSPYNRDACKCYTILSDIKFTQSGTGSNPSPSGNLLYLVKLFKNFVKNIIMANATSSGFDKFYLAGISTSSLIPFPRLEGRCMIRFAT
jgi:hypothetical protein